MRNRVFLALGSNVGNKEKNIAYAITLLGEKVQGIQRTSLYHSKAVGYTDQDDFINTVTEGMTDLSPDELLKFTQTTEQKVGRVYRFRWGPREIDIDILFYNDIILKDSQLEIPHPRLAERDFVLVPLRDLAPDFIHPVLRKTVQELVQGLGSSSILAEVEEV